MIAKICRQENFSIIRNYDKVKVFNRMSQLEKMLAKFFHDKNKNEVSRHGKLYFLQNYQSRNS